MAQCMRPAVGGRDAEGDEPAIDYTVDAAAYYRAPRCLDPQKYLLTGCSRANRINVACQGLGNGRDERVNLRLSPLQTEYSQDASAPVYLFETQ